MVMKRFDSRFKCNNFFDFPAKVTFTRTRKYGGAG